MEEKIIYFENAKQDNTEETFKLVEEKIKLSQVKKLVIASTTGTTAKRAMDYFKDKDVKLIIIPHQYGFSESGNRFPKELVETIREAGHEVHFGTMLFHTDKLFGTSSQTVAANFLRCFSEGVKVCFEIVLMASDAGLLDAGEEVIAIAGTGLKADTAMVMEASTSQNLRGLKVNEILCKPLNKRV